jgi:outer membrane protein assembly factor BamB
VADRDTADTRDVFRCLGAADGSDRWTVAYAAPAQLDYGNAPRATPLIAGEKVYLYGALGHLHCVDLASGKILWKRNLRLDFKAHDERPWGAASSPLLVDDKLIVNPGGKDASLAALDPATGAVIWQTPGGPAAFSSFIVGQFGGTRQIVGYDKTSLGGWDPATGHRLWQLIPPHKNDFNVPTPIEFEGQLLVATENNGTRLYRFREDGTIAPEPVAQFNDLAPDSHTPVVVGGRLFGVWGALFCLDVRAGLKPLWTSEDKTYADYASIIGSGGLVLVTTQYGELLLVDAAADEYRVVSRLKLFDDDSGVLAHPALVGHRLYVRSSTAIHCLDLEP